MYAPKVVFVWPANLLFLGAKQKGLSLVFCFINQLGGRRHRAHIMLNGAQIHAAEGVDFRLILQYQWK